MVQSMSHQFPARGVGRLEIVYRHRTDMGENKNWTDKQRLAVFSLYCRTPFGRLHKNNSEIIALAEALGRTPSSVAMKACNFTSLDPAEAARGVKGLTGASRADRALWDEFARNATTVSLEADAAYESVLAGTNPSPDAGEPSHPEGESETLAFVRVRRTQSFFRAALLAAYEERCAISGIAVPELLTASHIIPWRDDERRRADPRNGLLLNALYDRAFDRGLIAIDGDSRVMVSPLLRERTDWPPEFLAIIAGLPGRVLRAPQRFAPDPDALAYHRDHVFRANR
jgi:hypothetical protein